MRTTLWMKISACFLSCGLFFYLGVARSAAKDPKVAFKTVTIMRQKDGTRVVLLTPVLAYNVFGYLKDNSATPAKNEILSCVTGQDKVGTIADAYGKPTDGTALILTLDCGAVSLQIAGIDFQ